MLSSDDPVRVFQQFATLDLLSGGRAEIMAGRGSFIESFPLFGYDLDDYDELFAEKLDLLLALRDARARHVVGRAPRRRSTTSGVYPRPVQDPLPVWIAVGGTPQSVVRAGALGLPLALAIIGGKPERFAPLVDALPRAPRPRPATTGSLRVEHQLARLRRRRDLEAGGATTSFPPIAEVMNRIGRERGWPPDDRAHVRRRGRPARRAAVGSPQQVTEKILFQHELFGHDRFLLQFALGTMPHAR